MPRGCASHNDTGLAANVPFDAVRSIFTRRPTRPNVPSFRRRCAASLLAPSSILYPRPLSPTSIISRKARPAKAGARKNRKHFSEIRAGPEKVVEPHRNLPRSAAGRSTALLREEVRIKAERVAGTGHTVRPFIRLRHGLIFRTSTPLAAGRSSKRPTPIRLRSCNCGCWSVAGFLRNPRVRRHVGGRELMMSVDVIR